MRRPREITAAAVVALIGSFVFLIFGLLLGGYLGTMLYSLSKQYPGLDINKSADTSVPQLIHILFTVSIAFAVLGVIGAFTAGGLLRMRAWARRSTIGWCIGSTLACLLGLVYPGPRSEFHINSTMILTLMLLLFPINAWWLLLFYRPEIRMQFSPPRSSHRAIAWDFSGLLMPKSILFTAGGLLLVALCGWTMWRNSPMREIERARAAVAGANGWHYHTIRFNPASPGVVQDTIDKDTVCPSYQRTIQAGLDYKGEPAVFDSINYLGHVYGHVDGQWVLPRGATSPRDIPIFECEGGPMGGDETSLPFAAILEDGTARQGGLRDVDGESCRDYEIAVPTPHDPAEKEFRFTICINEQDHLPRQTRRIPSGRTQELASTYKQWKNHATPELPPDFNP